MYLQPGKSHTIEHPLADMTITAKNWILPYLFIKITQLLDEHHQRSHPGADYIWLRRYGTSSGRVIEYCRDRRRWSQHDLAKSLNVHHTTISRLERNRRGVSIKMAKRLAQVFECDFRDFL